MANDPGWYPDPWQPARRRWWDGTAWSDHTWDPNRPAQSQQPQPQQQPQRPQQPMVWLQPPDPRRDLDDERKAAIWARRGYVAMCVARIVSGLIAVVAVSSLVDDFQRAADTGSTDQASSSGWQALNLPVSIALVLGLVAVIMWTYRATTVASKLNYPARHSPVWGILGWIVPVVNFWFPYQCVRDCLAPGNSERKSVGRWWMLYIVDTFVWMAAIAVSVFAGTAIALAIALPCIVISGLELQAALRVVDAVVADHAEAIGRLTTTH